MKLPINVYAKTLTTLPDLHLLMPHLFALSNFHLIIRYRFS